MAILTKSQILERLKSGDISIRPSLDELQLKPHAIDLRLGYTFLMPKTWQLTKNGREAMKIDHFDKNRPSYFEALELEEGQFFELLPGEYVIVSTLETVTMPNDLMGVLYPRSSTNRKGLSVDLTGIIDSGYEGQLAIPVRNNTAHQVVKLYPGERFCQIVFDRLDQAVELEESRYHKKDIIEGFIRNQKTANHDEEEIELISQGKTKELKERFKIDLSK
jgi:dCTP deaminase